MRKNDKNSFLLCVIALLLLSYFSDYAAGDPIEFPLDNGGRAIIFASQNSIYILGVELGEDVPGWQDIITWKGPGCAIIDQEDYWWCGNPWRDGHISTAFAYKLNVMFPKGCEGRICFSITGHAEYGEICIEDETGRVNIEIDILDISTIRSNID